VASFVIERSVLVPLATIVKRVGVTLITAADAIVCSARNAASPPKNSARIDAY